MRSWSSEGLTLNISHHPSRSPHPEGEQARRIVARLRKRRGAGQKRCLADQHPILLPHDDGGRWACPDVFPCDRDPRHGSGTTCSSGTPSSPFLRVVDYYPVFYPHLQRRDQHIVVLPEIAMYASGFELHAQ